MLSSFTSSDELTLVILRFGYDVVDSSQLNSFYVDALSPQKKSRGGFPDSIVHNDIVTRLQEMWGERHDAVTANWQRWATELVRIPVHELDSAMRRGPPASLNAHFKPKQTQMEQQLQVVHEQSAISHSFIRQIAPRIDRLSGIVKDLVAQLNHVQREVDSLNLLVANHKEIVAAYRVASKPTRSRRTRSAAEEVGLWDQSDQDHASTTSSESSDDDE